MTETETNDTMQKIWEIVVKAFPHARRINIDITPNSIVIDEETRHYKITRQNITHGGDLHGRTQENRQTTEAVEDFAGEFGEEK